MRLRSGRTVALVAPVSTVAGGTAVVAGNPLINKVARVNTGARGPAHSLPETDADLDQSDAGNAAEVVAGYLYLAIIPGPCGYLVKPGRTCDLARRIREYRRETQGAFFVTTYPSWERAPMGNNRHPERIMLREFKSRFGRPVRGHEYFTASVEQAMEAFECACGSIYSSRELAGVALPMQID